MKRLPHFALFAVICSGCDDDGVIVIPGNDVDTRREVPFDVVSCPADSAQLYMDESEVVNSFEATVRDPHEFRELYLTVDPFNQDEIPTIDFNEKVAIVLYMGRQTNSSPEVRMGRVVEDGSSVIVEYENVKPPPGCPGDNSLNYPYCVVTIDQTNKEVRFSPKKVVECVGY